MIRLESVQQLVTGCPRLLRRWLFGTPQGNETEGAIEKPSGKKN
jgi:hypothetical protein